MGQEVKLGTSNAPLSGLLEMSMDDDVYWKNAPTCLLLILEFCSLAL